MAVVTTYSKKFLDRLFLTAVAAADPMKIVPGGLPEKPKGRTIVVGAGKASAAMAAAVEKHWRTPLEGLVLTRYGHANRCQHIEIVEAAHPVPDAAGFEAAARMANMVDGLGENDLVICLISGGGSALLTAPAPGITLQEKQDINRQLLSCGAPIDDMNCLRKHLSSLKGGRLALAAYPAKVVSLIISDVPGDDPAVVASGPTVPDPKTCNDALKVIEKYALHVPAHIIKMLEEGTLETPKPDHPGLAACQTNMIATPRLSLDAAANAARAAGYSILDLGDDLEGEARELGASHAEIAKAVQGKRTHTQPPAVILSGGETTVTLKGSGRGGRNAEYALALAIGLSGTQGISAIACDTDGIDGSEDNAGAYVSSDSLQRAALAGVDASARLADNDAYGFFDSIGDLVMTGPTLTNVNDFRAIVIEPAGKI